DSSVVSVVDHVPSAEDTEAFERDESVPTPRSPQIKVPFAQTRLRRARRLSYLSHLCHHPWRHIPSPPLHVSSPPLPLPPPTVDSSTYVEAPLGYRALTTPTSRNKVEESSTVAPRPTGGHRADYRFIGTMDAKIRRQRAEEVGYGIRDVWVDPTEAVEEVTPTTLEGVNARVTELTAVQEQDTHDVYAVIKDTQDRQTQLFQ
ncbi:hypothetical protein Tco_0143223, partial [Tanacetum coccineum]